MAAKKARVKRPGILNPKGLLKSVRKSRKALRDVMEYDPYTDKMKKKK